VILSTGGAKLDFRAPPDNLLVRQFVPQPGLLERAGAFVTHGVMNSPNQARLWRSVGDTAARRSAPGRRAQRGTRRQTRDFGA
jgi:hypothetical protein